MKNKLLLGLAIFLMLSVIFVRYTFNNRFDNFKLKLAELEKNSLEEFTITSNEQDSILAQGDQELYDFYSKEIKPINALVKADTVFSYLYLSKTQSYNIYSLNYIKCLINNYSLERQNIINRNLTQEYLSRLEKKFGENYSHLLDHFNPEDIKISKYPLIAESIKCTEFFPDFNPVIFVESSFQDLENYLTTKNQEIRKINKINKEIEKEFLNSVAKAKRQLNNEGKNHFTKALNANRSRILRTESENKVYKTENGRSIAYSIDKKIFEKKFIQTILEEAQREQYKSNSLLNGAMPYSNCFGSNNYCDSWGCSQISVKSGGSDVLVTIKNSSRRVIRHGFVKAGRTVTFNLADGSYQVFFYSGKGWNPHKEMSSNTCQSLRGGFLSKESFTKDNYVTVNNEKLTYELILQEHGNLITKPSSDSEAF